MSGSRHYQFGLASDDVETVQKIGHFLRSSRNREPKVIESWTRRERLAHWLKVNKPECCPPLNENKKEPEYYSEAESDFVFRLRGFKERIEENLPFYEVPDFSALDAHAVRIIDLTDED